MASNGVSIDAKLNEQGVVTGAKKIKASLEEIEKADKALNWDGVEEGSKQMTEAKGNAEGLADGIGDLGGKLGAIGSAAMGALGLAAFADYATESSEATARLNATLAGTGRSAEEFDGVLQRIYAANYGESFDDIAESANQVLQIMGTDIEPAALESITEKAIVLRDTFGMDVPASVKAAQVMMQNFGMSADSAFDMLAMGAQEGLNINDDMLDAFSEYSPYFKQLGLDATDMYNAFASGANVSMYGVDKAGDAFKEFGIRVVDGSDSTRAAFAAIGLSADDYAQKIMAGGDSAKQATTEIINGLLAIEDPVERNAQGVALFGTQWEDLGQDGAEAMLSLMGQAVECEGALDAIDAVRYDSIGAALGGIGRGIEVAVFQPITERALPALSSLAGWFSSNKDAIAGAIGQAFATLEKIAPVLAVIAAGYAAWVTYSNAVKALTALQAAYTAVVEAGGVAQWALNAAMAANPVGIVIAAITAVIAVFVLLWNNCEGFRNFWIGLWDSIMQKVQPIADWIYQNVITPIAAKFAEFQSAFGELWGAIVSNVQAAWELIAPIVQLGFQNMQTIFNAVLPVLQTIWNAAWGVISTVLGNAWNIMSGIVGTIMGVIQGIIQTVTALIQGNWDGVWNGIKSIFETIVNGILQTGANIFNALSATIGSVLSGISAVWSSIWGAVYSVASGIWNNISSTIGGIINGISSTISSVINGIQSTVSSVFNAIQSAMTNPIETAKNTISGIIDTIKGFFNNFHIQLPHINLPHFSISPPGWQIGDLLKGSIPSLGIEWYATGGVFNGASIIGVGEAGPEAVVPLQGRYMQPFAKAVGENMAMPTAQEIGQAVAAALIAAGIGQAVVNLDGRTVGQLLAPYLDTINGARYSDAVRGLAQ